ncbi:MAG: type I methionyl aminopeptidase [Candidatus Portnoybacteria bacterium CG10_big_fil_rev_8_21_14_0_10_36_7]|uniref:Methionine aminopeptidase n=1 Tax=Candidatus Portnoybacteria bacterium CG10_big_fil_rev_8_21_14_0_10_36_7 TaxID=1974812 RepID=A0A2M8KDA4_9BACT|nr:MAG: type I methionyl aminopeptidase [Candidatus Portnoybacteria bacterium CG10_big_fil_rev_8_21_14_0_10_36_7]
MAILKNSFEQEAIRQGGKILAKILGELSQEAKESVSTLALENMAERMISEANARPSFLNYGGYPAILCTSINEEIVHVIPTQEKILKNGDLLSIDLGIEYDGFFTDSAITVPVGIVDKDAQRLIDITKEALSIGIAQANVGGRIGDIGFAIQEYVEKNNFSVIRDLVGHGTGKKVHEAPQVPNFGKKGSGDKIVEGMVLAIEPMVSLGGYEIKKSNDGYGFETKDGTLAAHFEHTVLIGKNSAEIITQL